MAKQKWNRREFIVAGSAAAGAFALGAAFAVRKPAQENLQLPGNQTSRPSTPASPSPAEQPRNLGDYDVYGGWKELQGRKTGFFHTEQIDGKWWLVTPEGNAFWSKGINHIRFDEHVDVNGVSEWHQNNLAKDESEANWVKRTGRRIADWGFNTVGSWSQDGLQNESTMGKQGISYTTMLYFNEDGANNSIYSTFGIPDVFNARWEASLDLLAQKWCDPRVDDPYCIGYFLGNEMHWDSAGWRRVDGKAFDILDAYLTLDSGAPGRTQAQDFLSTKNKTVDTITQEEKWEFAGLVAEEFARLTTEAIKKYDPNHMILGARFAGYAREPVVTAIGKYSDVISLNAYDMDPNLENIHYMERVAKRPVMITEGGFRVRQGWSGNTKGAGPVLETQEDKAKELEEHFRILAAEPTCVGFHVFEYADQPLAGRKGDGENSNYGFVNVKDEPYPTVTKMQSLMPTLEKRRVGQRI